MIHSFTGFSQDTFAFLSDLEANNSKEWFVAHREQYEACWLQPALAFIDAMKPVVLALCPPLKAEARLNGSLRRIHRDTRFSKDKTPYNPRLHMVFWCGDHPNRSPAFHIVLHPTHVGYGAGQWAFTPAELTSYRRSVCAPEKRAILIAALEAARNVRCELDPETLKRVPAGFAMEDRHAPLIKRKSLVVRTLHSDAIPKQILNEDCVEYTAELMSTLGSIISWLQEYVR